MTTDATAPMSHERIRIDMRIDVRLYRAPHVYIAGPYRASNSWLRELNIRSAETLALDVARLGAVPICPHTMYRYFDGAAPDAIWLGIGLQLLGACDAVATTDGWAQSAGTRVELDQARGLQLPIFEDAHLPEGRQLLSRWLDMKYAAGALDLRRVRTAPGTNP